MLPCGTLSLWSLRILSGFAMQLLFRSEWRVSQKASCHIDDAGNMRSTSTEHEARGRKSTRSTQLDELDELKAGCPRPLANDLIQWPVQRKPHWLCLTRLWDRHRMFRYHPTVSLPYVPHRFEEIQHLEDQTLEQTVLWSVASIQPSNLWRCQIKINRMH